MQSQSQSFWKPLKKSKYNFGMPKLKSYPKRTVKEWKLIDSKPYGDSDKDKVMNYFDCKPLVKRQQGWFDKKEHFKVGKKDIKNIDKGVRTHMQRINKAGFETYACCSGLKKEHKGKYESPYVSIAIPKEIAEIGFSNLQGQELPPHQVKNQAAIKKLIAAGREAGWKGRKGKYMMALPSVTFNLPESEEEIKGVDKDAAIERNPEKARDKGKIIKTIIYRLSQFINVDTSKNDKAKWVKAVKVKDFNKWALDKKNIEIRNIDYEIAPQEISNMLKEYLNMDIKGWEIPYVGTNENQILVRTENEDKVITIPKQKKKIQPKNKTVTLYHGTNPNLKEKILKEGIQPQSNATGAVFLTGKKSVAKWAGKSIIKVKLPSEKVEELLKNQRKNYKIAVGEYDETVSDTKLPPTKRFEIISLEGIDKKYLSEEPDKVTQGTPGSLQGSNKPTDIIKAIEEGKKPVGELYKWQTKGIKTNLPYKELKFSKKEIAKNPKADMSPIRVYYKKDNEALAKRALDITKRGVNSVSDDKELGKIYGYTDNEINEFVKRKENRKIQKVQALSDFEAIQESIQKEETMRNKQAKEERVIEEKAEKEDRGDKEEAVEAWKSMSVYEKHKVGKKVAEFAEVPGYMHDRYAKEITKSFNKQAK